MANLIVGPNASGKTSLLEAMAMLGRGKSFRGVTAQHVVRHGAEKFVVHGKVRRDGVEHRVGVSNGGGGLEIRIDGEDQRGSAALAELVPLQIVDPNVHELVAGGPEERRRYLDWLLFHVEPSYLDSWRRFRRALRQRNAALKEGASPSVLSSWDREFAAAGEAVADQRSKAFTDAGARLRAMAAELLGVEVGFVLTRGWSGDEPLLAALEGGKARDVALGTTQSGPHRADIKLRYDQRLAKRLVSRGQQKLLACSMVLASTAAVRERLDRPLLLLLDDPAAELDSDALAALMGAVESLECQVVATALSTDKAPLGDKARLFHVKHGQLSSA